MTCTCGTTGVYNEVRGLGFYYCRDCKIEIELQDPPVYVEKQLSQEEIDELFNPIISYSGSGYPTY